MLSRLKDKGAFTLIELIIVVVILGILILIVLAATRGDKNKASDQSIKATTARIAQALEDCYETNGNAYPVAGNIGAIVTDACVRGKFDTAPTTTGITGSSSATAFSLVGTPSQGDPVTVTNKQ